MHIDIDHHRIEIIRGDISEESTDAVVNAANNHLWMGAGVAGALKRRGGESIEEEAVAQGPVEVGTAVITGGGALRAKWVIHAAVMGQDLHTDAAAISGSVRSVLKLAEAKRLSSVSFPALGTGVGGFSVYHCAALMISAAVEFLMTSRSVSLIRFVMFDETAEKAFEDELRLQFSAKRHH
ncbi:MAG TPA: macro domain-containing protein [Bacteroidota bacterium]|nr:macro domain-containing protein [Bacteroidota bacterium]